MVSVLSIYAKREITKKNVFRDKEIKSNAIDMKKRTRIPHLKNEILTVVGVLMTMATSNYVQAQTTEVFGRLTRYAVKPDSQKQFRRSLSDYVSQAMGQESNIQAEAYYERDNQLVLWLIERWRNRNELDRFGKSSQSRAIDSLRSKALRTNAETYYVTDLEPISKRQWRRPAKAEDHPLTQMLFVDSKDGTQDEFKAVYHVAMPQFRAEPGVVTYQLSQVLGVDTTFVTYEKFRSEEAFQYHLKFPPIKPVIDYLHTSIKEQPFEKGLHTLVEFAPLTRD